MSNRVDILIRIEEYSIVEGNSGSFRDKVSAQNGDRQRRICGNCGRPSNSEFRLGGAIQDACSQEKCIQIAKDRIVAFFGG